MPRLVLVAALTALATPLAAQPKLPRVRIETAVGVIEAEIDTVRAPITGRNFLAYVAKHFYDHGVFHRTVTLANQPASQVKIEVIQASGDTTRGAEALPPIPLERTNKTGLRHTAGTLSMARLAVDSAEDQFFICVTDQPALDFGGKRNPDGQGFAAFGRVISGMDVVKRIHTSKAEGQRLTPVIRIIRVTRN